MSTFKRAAIVALALTVGAVATVAVTGPGGSDQEPATSSIQAVSGNPDALRGVEIPLLFQADQATGDVRHANGLLELDYGDDHGVLRRGVEVWVADDGRYRVHVASLDGSGAAEEVAYDGQGHQLVLVTDPGGYQKAFVVEGDKHFAITAMEAAEATLSDGLVTSAHVTTDVGSIDYTVDSINSASAADLELVIPEGVEVLDADQFASGGDSSLIATASRSTTMYGIYGTACLYAYNYRNSTSDYFYAYSNRVGGSACLYMDVSLWDWSHYNGNCGGNWQAGGPLAANFSSASATFAVSSNRYACGNHAGWDSSWILRVAWRSFTAAIPG